MLLLTRRLCWETAGGLLLRECESELCGLCERAVSELMGEGGER